MKIADVFDECVGNLKAMFSESYDPLYKFDVKNKFEGLGFEDKTMYNRLMKKLKDD